SAASNERCDINHSPFQSMTRSQVQSYKSFDAALLLDTGAFVALIDRSERRHMDCVAALEQWSGPIVTSEAVLTEKYRDIPMDFADATLVALGEELDTDQVFTLDQRGFSRTAYLAKNPF